MDHLLKCLVCAVVSAVLFFVLTPGVLLTLPPCKNGSVFLALQKEKKKNDVCVTSYEAAAVHALVFGVVMFLVCLMMKDNAGATSSV